MSGAVDVVPWDMVEPDAEPVFERDVVDVDRPGGAWVACELGEDGCPGGGVAGLDVFNRDGDGWVCSWCVAVSDAMHEDMVNAIPHRWG